MIHSMTWADFYLICFAVGFSVSFLSFVLGGPRTGHLHLPHFHGHVGGAQVPAAHVPAAGAAQAGHVPATAAHPSGAHPAGGDSASAHGQGNVSPFNLVSVTAFLAWFGGAGYLLSRFSVIWVGFGLVLSIGAGLLGATIIFLFLSKVLISHEETMDAADYEMVGVLGKVCVPIREGGTGELIYSQMGTRRVCGARSDNGDAIARGTEVVVTRYEKGIAYVRLWSEMSGEQG